MYDGVRQRHAVREIDVDTINGFPPYYFVTSEVFSEYDGDTIYNDFTAVGSDVTILRSYQPGIARVDDPFGSPVTSYYHADKLGTTRGMTTLPVSLTEASVYTAFGELVDGTNHRYGYVGSQGYQGHNEFPLLHVGARYYEPGIGRFAQRDPIGIRGGANVYQYVKNRPTAGADPSGLLCCPACEANYYRNHPPPARPATSAAPAVKEPILVTQEDMEHELEVIKKNTWGSGTLIGLSCTAGQWWNGVAFALAALIDMVIHYDEPANPVFGGDYSKW